ncbi:hypothetical protein LTR56_022860 [Elasticomyces elasticus]|nr:hypothetical protein LTR56_022860 [Elasticomyces elasticus]KAK3657020.1 hypothetical protein LTR22_009521 [Elasticomyces elasticus]KAK4916243.1 hypothetical protein LTR49_015748 [Elasticomyces elasticus]KAK5764220.1 hypothetical protein LTS12_005671 [Elasticomyces elasticus]
MAMAAASSLPSQIPTTAMATNSMIIPQRPFRLMALPPELRVTIYRFALLLPQPVVLVSTYDSMLGLGRHPLPPLIKVSRTLFDEAVPIYYSINRFEFRVQIGPGSQTTGMRYPEVVMWACKHMALVRQLRNLVITALGTNEPMIAASLSPKTGLSVQYVHPKLACSRKLFERHAELVEQYRNRENLEGEALVLMFGTGPSRWHELKQPSMGPAGETWSMSTSRLRQLVRYMPQSTPEDPLTNE